MNQGRWGEEQGKKESKRTNRMAAGAIVEIFTLDTSKATVEIMQTRTTSITFPAVALCRRRRIQTAFGLEFGLALGTAAEFLTLRPLQERGVISADGVQVLLLLLGSRLLFRGHVCILLLLLSILCRSLTRSPLPQ